MHSVIRRFSSSKFLVVYVLLIWLGVSSSTSAANAIVDGGFQQAAVHPNESAWIVPKAGGTIKGMGRVGEGDAIGSAHAAYLTPSKDYADELVQPLLPLVPGRAYILTAWARAEKQGAEALVGVRTQQDFTRIYRGLTGDGWERIELSFIATDGWVQVVLSNSASSVFWDDVVLQESRTAAERVAAQWEASLKQGKPLYTGLVVNALGTGLERGMSPKIYDARGKLVFTGIGASFDQLIRKGLVAYVHTLEEATAHPRMAVSEEYPMRLPLVVDAQGVSGLPRTGVIIGIEDARKIRAATDQYDFLGRYAIVFVVD